MMTGMPDMRRRTPEPAAGAPEVQFKPGMANELLQELAPLLAEEGIDVDNIDVPDPGTLQQALNRAIERRDMAIRACARDGLPADVDPVGRVGDLLQVLGGELDVDCAGVLVQALDLRGSGDRRDPGVLGQQPGQRYLRCGGALVRGDCRQLFDESLVGGAGLLGTSPPYAPRSAAAPATRPCRT